MNNDTSIFIAGWKDGIRDPKTDRHWRLYRGLSTRLIPARDICFELEGERLPLRTGSSKVANAEGFHVWFACRGSYSVDGDTAYVDLSSDGDAFEFSVRTKSLYDSQDWLNWRLYRGRDQSVAAGVGGDNVRYISFMFRGKPIRLSSEARKISDPRELLAWVQARGVVRLDDGQATIILNS